jgi:GGDEF domain-containing protein
VDYNTMTTFVMMVLTFISFLLLYGMFEINIDNHTNKYRLFVSIVAMGIILLLDSFVQSKLNFLISTLIVNGILVVSHYNQNRLYLLIFYSYTIIGLLICKIYNENPLFDGWYGLVLIGIPLLTNMMFKGWKLKNPYYHFLLTTQMMTSVIFMVIISVIYGIYDSFIYGGLLFVSLGIQFWIYRFYERDYQHYNHYYHRAFYDLESNTYSNNYLIEQIEQLDEQDEDYQLMFIDIVIPRSKATKDKVIAIIHPLVETIRGVVSEDAIIGRLNFVRFCIILKSNDNQPTINELKQRIQNLEHDHISFVINVIEKEFGSLHVLEKTR